MPRRAKKYLHDMREACRLVAQFIDGRSWAITKTMLPYDPLSSANVKYWEKPYTNSTRRTPAPHNAYVTTATSSISATS